MKNVVTTEQRCQKRPIIRYYPVGRIEQARLVCAGHWEDVIKNRMAEGVSIQGSMMAPDESEGKRCSENAD